MLALFLAVLMALTAFTGAFSAYAASADPSYHDDALKANALAWVELTDEQTCAALLDYVDDILYDLKMPVSLSGNYVVVSVNLNGTLDSVSGLLDIVDQLKPLLIRQTAWVKILKTLPSARSQVCLTRRLTATGRHAVKITEPTIPRKALSKPF